MWIEQWSAPSRTIDRAESADFYESPLDRPCLFHFTTSDFRQDPHAGPFSLKLVLRGREDYWFGRRKLRLEPGRFAFVAAGRDYASAVEDEAESLSIFLPADWAAEMWQAARGDEAALDRPVARAPDDLPAVSLRSDARFTRALDALRGALGGRDRQRIEDAAQRALLAAAAAAQGGLPDARIDAARRATREELLARALRARELIDDLHGIDCTLDRLAAAACLSRYHLLRVFAQAFGCTPGDYARRRRVAHAAALERQGLTRAAAAAKSGYSRGASLRRAARRIG